jgi:hypothetical protein
MYFDCYFNYTGALEDAKNIITYKLDNALITYTLVRDTDANLIIYKVVWGHSSERLTARLLGLFSDTSIIVGGTGESRVQEP